ncbi:hypothetical protein R1sor_004852 [Riccia sorocarpa]|uniref:Reverse transcriptase domain-containing protein n=1 Tax=Riccia sorocarpa TaxID=122646 RepID=A0ABD3HJU4_9MARC
MLGGLIDQQQTGFIAWRSITENILSLRLAQDWVQETGQDIIFFKFDFQKAYDMVSHSYLWDTLAALGIEAVNISRIQGLVRGGSSQVQINGNLTTSFQIGRGVRQGCPLAPLLFVIATQPLMRFLREEERSGRLKGVTYGGNNTLLHQVYADDTGISLTMDQAQFERLTTVIQMYEFISSAKLNLSKSQKMPLRPGRNPDWLYNTGCAIVEGRNTILYLGVIASTVVDERLIADSIAKKIEKKLTHWKFRGGDGVAQRWLLAGRSLQNFEHNSWGSQRISQATSTTNGIVPTQLAVGRLDGRPCGVRCRQNAQTCWRSSMRRFELLRTTHPPILLAKFLMTTWKERNTMRFQFTRHRIPTKMLLSQTLTEVDAFPTTRFSDAAWQTTVMARATVLNWISTWNLHQQQNLSQMQNDPYQLDEGLQTTSSSSARSSTKHTDTDTDDGSANWGPTAPDIETHESDSRATSRTHLSEE